MRGLRIPETRRARTLRADAPSAEALLWSRVRARRLGGFKFVRQEPLGPYFADFCCREEKLVVEVDGATHSTEAELARVSLEALPDSTYKDSLLELCLFAVARSF